MGAMMRREQRRRVEEERREKGERKEERAIDDSIRLPCLHSAKSSRAHLGWIEHDRAEQRRAEERRTG